MSSLGCKTLGIVISFHVLWSICWSFPFVHFKNGPVYLTIEYSPGVYLFEEISAADLSFGKLPHSSKLLFSNIFFHFCLFDGVHFQNSQVLVIFVFSKGSDFFMIWQFYSFRCLSLYTFAFEDGTFSYVRFHSYILTVYSYWFHQDLQFCFIFCKQLDAVH